MTKGLRLFITFFLLVSSVLACLLVGKSCWWWHFHRFWRTDKFVAVTRFGTRGLGLLRWMAMDGSGQWMAERFAVTGPQQKALLEWSVADTTAWRRGFCHGRLPLQVELTTKKSRCSLSPSSAGRSPFVAKPPAGERRRRITSRIGHWQPRQMRCRRIKWLAARTESFSGHPNQFSIKCRSHSSSSLGRPLQPPPLSPFPRAQSSQIWSGLTRHLLIYSSTLAWMGQSTSWKYS